MGTITKKFVRALVSEIVKLDQSLSESTLEIGKILNTINKEGYYKNLGYKNMASFIQGEKGIEFSVTAAGHLATMYSVFQKLKYNYKQQLTLISQHSPGILVEILRGEESKIDLVEVRRRATAIEKGKNKQYNFVPDKKSKSIVDAVLVNHGMIVTKGKKGQKSQYKNLSAAVSDALLRLAEIEGIGAPKKKKAGSKKRSNVVNIKAA